MRLTYEPTEEDEREGTFLTLSSFERSRLWYIDHDDLPNECKHSNGTIRLGTPVVMKLPVERVPQNVELPTGYPDDVFVGFVTADCRTHFKTSEGVHVGSGHFTTRTPQFDARDSFELKQHVFANSKGLLTSRPEGVIAGRVISLPTVELPFLGVVGRTEG